MSYISGYVRLRDNVLRLNGKEVFSSSGSLDDFLQKAYDALGIDYPKFYKMDRLSKAGILAAEVLLKGFPRGEYKPDQVGLVFSNASASLDTDLRYVEASKNAPSPAIFVYTLPNIVMGEVSIRHGFKGENAFFVADEFDSALLCDYTEEVLRQPRTKTCVAGWVEVMDQQHDVLVYLVEEENKGTALPHTAEQLDLLYR